jgi:hypothetical protein
MYGTKVLGSAWLAAAAADFKSDEGTHLTGAAALPNHGSDWHLF